MTTSGLDVGVTFAPVRVSKALAQEHVHTDKIDLARMLPVLFHTAEDAGRFITAGVVIVRDPETGGGARDPREPR